MFGYSYKTFSFCCIRHQLHASNTSLHSTSNTSLQPASICVFHLLLCALLKARQNVVALGILDIAMKRNSFGLDGSLEYLLHYALNSGDPPFLTATFQLLSHLPSFSHLLVRCLRKQERSMWPFTIKNCGEVGHLFHSFLLSNDMEYATTTVSILQGLACSISDQWNEENRTQRDTVPLAQWKEFVEGECAWILDAYAGVMTEKEEGCVAHACALQLLIVVIIRGYFSQLADVYRFLIMEVRNGRELHP